MKSDVECGGVAPRTNAKLKLHRLTTADNNAYTDILHEFRFHTCDKRRTRFYLDGFPHTLAHHSRGIVEMGLKMELDQGNTAPSNCQTVN